jgi:hypothetical protein
MHEPWQSQLPLYVAGTLPPEDRDAVEAHLATCEACRALVREWERIGAAVRRESAARVEGASLPPLPVGVTRSQGEAPLSRNGRGGTLPAWEGPSHDHKETHDMSVMTTRTIQRTRWQPLPRPRLAPTLIAAVLMAVLFGGALLLFNARQDGTTTSPGAPSGGDGSQPAAIQSTATDTPPPTATPFPTQPVVITATPVPTQPVVITATPVLPTAVPPHDAEAMPPAGEPSVVITATPFPTQPVVITATPVPFEGPASQHLDPTVQPPPLATSVSLEGVRYEAQGWNNAGPASLAMALSVYGWGGDQDTAAAWLKPDPEDKSVSPWQMVAYVNGQTPYRAIYRMGGTLDVLKSAVAAGFPVIAAVGMDTESDGWFGHYQLVTGYDEGAGVLLIYDSYLGPTTEPRRVPFSEFDAAWWPFNRTFVVVFPADRAGDVQAVLLGYDDPAYGVGRSLEIARTEVSRDSADKWAWFNMGTSYANRGEYSNAAIAFDQALSLGLPFRALWYQFGPYEAYFKIGRYTDVIALAASVLDVTPYVEEAHYWQALAHAAQGEVQDARRALEQVIALNPNFFVGELARFQPAPDAYAPVSLPGASPPVLLATPTPILATPIRVELTPTLPPVPFASDTPVPAEPTLPPTLLPTATPIPGN